MEPMSMVLAVGVVVGTTVVAGIVAALFRADEPKRQIKTTAKDARRRMNTASREYVKDVDTLLRR
jgi:gas vesicle protein